MSEERFQLAGVLAAARAQPEKSPGGRAIMFMAARRGEGVTTVAHAAALAAAASETVYAIDLDLHRNALARMFAEENPPLGPRIDARLNGVAFHQIRGADGQPWIAFKPAFNFHRVGRSRIYASVFDAHELPQGGRISISGEPHYWNAARAGGATVIVDAPALERSRVGLKAAPHMDGVVLVVAGDDGAAPAAMSAKAEILAAGGALLGIVYTQASAPVMAMHRFLPQAV
ncbi:MAG TPA: hypothetical protein VG841_16085 [Caulobacterales bacterium]|nr:hypothetical protein [Caulobacterales bacterium]